ncbi:MAG: hypothetical protein HZR80_19860 [Candidatus Heimdallarchaeota archaeon]
MGISYRYAKHISKNGLRGLIALLVLDTSWSLIRFIIYHAAFDGNPSNNFMTIDNIITNCLYTAFLGALAVGMFMLGIYYFKISKIGLIASIFLIGEVGVKTAYIFFRFTQLISQSYDDPIILNLIQVFEMTTGFLLISTFVVFDFFQRQLKSRAGIGYGPGFLPYVFGIPALIYPITNILNLANVDYINTVAALPIMHMLSYVAAILEIILFFDLLRRFDYMQPLQYESEDSIIYLKTAIQANKQAKILDT